MANTISLQVSEPKGLHNDGSREQLLCPGQTEPASALSPHDRTEPEGSCVGSAGAGGSEEGALSTEIRTCAYINFN